MQIQCHKTCSYPDLGLPTPFPLGKDLAQFSESPLKLTFPLQWRHLVVNKGDATGSQPPASQGSRWREISPPRNPGLPGALMSNWQDLAFPFPAALHSSPPDPDPMASPQARAATSHPGPSRSSLAAGPVPAPQPFKNLLP